MVDAVLKQSGMGARQNSLDVAFRAATWFFALLVLLILCGVIVSLVVGALPALQHFGWAFIVTQVMWSTSLCERPRNLLPPPVVASW